MIGVSPLVKVSNNNTENKVDFVHIANIFYNVIIMKSIKLPCDSIVFFQNVVFTTSFTLRLSRKESESWPLCSYCGTSLFVHFTTRPLRPVISATLSGPPRRSIISSKGLKQKNQFIFVGVSE